MRESRFSLAGGTSSSRSTLVTSEDQDSDSDEEPAAPISVLYIETTGIAYCIREGEIGVRFKLFGVYLPLACKAGATIASLKDAVWSMAAGSR
jgi:hypothetical protein